MVAPANEMTVRPSIKFYYELEAVGPKVLFYYLLGI